MTFDQQQHKTPCAGRKRPRSENIVPSSCVSFQQSGLSKSDTNDINTMHRSNTPFLTVVAVLLFSPVIAEMPTQLKRWGAAHQSASSSRLNGKGSKKAHPSKFNIHMRSQNHRQMAKQGKGSKSSSYSASTGSWIGCLGMSCEDLDEAWIFPDDMPPCPGHMQKYSNEDDSCTAWKKKKSSGKGKGGSSSSRGAGKGGKGGSAATNYAGDGDSSSGNGESDSSGNYSGNDNYSGNGGDNIEGDSYVGYSGGDNNGGGGNNYNDGNNYSGGGNEGGGGNNSNGNTGNNNGLNNYSGDNNGGGSSASFSEVATFDINICSSFSDVWLWDLSLTCASTETLEDCECKTAQQMLNSGALVCPEDGEELCPSNCPVCWTCLTLLGCTMNQSTPPTVDSESAVPYVLVAFLAAAFVSLLLYREKKRQGNIGVGPAYGTGYTDPNQLDTPYVAPPIYGETGPLVPTENNVWLAPIT